MIFQLLKQISNSEISEKSDIVWYFVTIRKLRISNSEISEKSDIVWYFVTIRKYQSLKQISDSEIR